MGEGNKRGDFAARRTAALAKDREIEHLRRLKDLFGCVLKQQGRVRLSKREVDSLGNYAIRVSREGDTFMVSWEGA